MVQIITNNSWGGGWGGWEKYVAWQDIAISWGLQSDSGSMSISVSDAISLEWVIAYWWASQSWTPTPTSPVDIECNNWVLKFDGNLYADWTQETISDGTNVANAEILLSVSSNRDEQNLITWKITRNVKVLVLDWTEDWTKNWTHFEAELLDNNAFSHLVCTHFKNEPVALNDLAIYKSSGSPILQIRYDAQADVDAFKSWLASEYANNTPVMVLYALETPTTETVAWQTLALTDWAWTFTITASQISPLNIWVSYRIPWNIIDFTNETWYITEADLPDLSWYQTKSNLVTSLTNPDDTHYPSAKAVSDAISWGGAWDMLKSVYDPNNVNANAFDYNNFINTPTIPTDNCQLANWCWYTTCTWNAIDSCVVHLAWGETITGQKTFTQPTKIQSGDATWALIIWANLNSSVVSANNRKMARVWMPSFDTCAPVTIISWDSQNSAVNLVDFWWNPLATWSAAPDFIRFVVAKTHWSTCGDKINMFEVSNYEWADVNFLQHKKWISLNAKTMLSDDAIPTAWDCGCLVPSTRWVQWELGSYAKCTDIPTDNCQLANWCDYATCCYVNDSINSVTAYYITKNAQGDQFATYAELAAATTFYSGWVVRVPTKNDYTIVLADENHDNATTRYIYNSGWEYQYTVNETALTQAQLDAINSGITAAKVTCYDSCYAQCCDIPTDNCQLSNGCWYTTCTWTLVASDLTPYAQTSCIACINWCCLTNGGNISVDGAFDSCPYTQAEYNQLEIDTPSVLSDGVWRLIYE